MNRIAKQKNRIICLINKIQNKRKCHGGDCRTRPSGWIWRGAGARRKRRCGAAPLPSGAPSPASPSPLPLPLPPPPPSPRASSPAKVYATPRPPHTSPSSVQFLRSIALLLSCFNTHTHSIPSRTQHHILQVIFVIMCALSCVPSTWWITDRKLRSLTLHSPPGKCIFFSFSCKLFSSRGKSLQDKHTSIWLTCILHTYIHFSMKIYALFTIII